MKERNKHLITQIIAKIIANYEPEKIILFGSYANGNATEHSDSDLLIIKDDPQPPIERRVKIRQILRMENREIALTPIVYTPQEIAARIALGDDFMNDILNNGEVVYAG